MRIRLFLTAGLALTSVLITSPVSAQEGLTLKKGESIGIIGNTLADRMQHHGWLETYIQALHPNLDLTIRNLGYAADELKVRDRADNFGNPDQWLTKVKADVVFAFFGRNEALRGDEGGVPLVLVRVLVEVLRRAAVESIRAPALRGD